MSEYILFAGAIQSCNETFLSITIKAPIRFLFKYSSNTTTNYEYDTDKNIYLRSVNNKSQNDYVTGKQLTVKNIIVYKVKYSNIQGDDKGRQTIDNVGTGTGYYISNGYAVPITWKKDSRSSATIYKYNNGKEIQVNDGNTFIQIMPDNQTLAIS